MVRDAQTDSLVVDSGKRVFGDVSRLMEARLPNIDADDPLRKTLEQIVDLSHRAGI